MDSVTPKKCCVGPAPSLCRGGLGLGLAPRRCLGSLLLTRARNGGTPPSPFFEFGKRMFFFFGIDSSSLGFYALSLSLKVARPIHSGAG